MTNRLLHKGAAKEKTFLTQSESPAGGDHHTVHRVQISQ